jgi:hypothetical protein
VGDVLVWVPSYWVEAGLAGLAGVDVEVVALGRDMGETGDVGPVTVSEPLPPAMTFGPCPASSLPRTWPRPPRYRGSERPGWSASRPRRTCAANRSGT